MNSFEKDLDKNFANFVPLSPITFIERAKDVYPEYESVIYGERKYTWKETYDRCIQFASSLEKQGITSSRVSLHLTADEHNVSSGLNPKE